MGKRMRAKFIYESLSDYLDPKSEDEIIHSLSTLSKEELGTKLIYTAEEGLTNVVKYIIKVGADINAKDNAGRTALYMASWKGHEQMAKILLDAGADVNAKDNIGWTALMWASSYGHKDIVTLLKKHGAK